MKTTYRAFYDDNQQVIYENKPSGNLVGELPLGTMPDLKDTGTLNRKDGGDPFERANFITGSGRRIIVKWDKKATASKEAVA